MQRDVFGLIPQLIPKRRIMYIMLNSRTIPISTFIPGPPLIICLATSPVVSTPAEPRYEPPLGQPNAPCVVIHYNGLPNRAPVCFPEHCMESEMKSKLLVMLFSLLLSLSAGVAVAQESGDGAMVDQKQSRAEMMERLQNMSAEEREAFRAERRAKWEGMSEEQREAARAKRGEMREKHRAQKRARWESMSEEERDAARAKRSERKAERRARWESMSDEQRDAARSRHRDRGEKRHGHKGQRGGN